MNVVYRVLTTADTDDVIAILVDTLLVDEPQCKSLDMRHPDDTEKFINIIVPAMLTSGLSFGAFDGQTCEMIGCRLTLVKRATAPNEAIYDLNDPKEEKMAKLDSINAFIYRDIDIFAEAGCDEIVHFYGLMVRQPYRQQGIAQRLVEKTIELAKNKAYSAVVCEASSNYSRRIFRRLGFRQLREVRFDEYIINGNVVFNDTFPHELYTLHCLNI